MKTTFITDINKIKFEVNTEVARLAFAGELDEKANEIPYKLIPDVHRTTVLRFTENVRSSVNVYSWLWDVQPCPARRTRTLCR